MTRSAEAIIALCGVVLTLTALAYVVTRGDLGGTASAAPGLPVLEPATPAVSGWQPADIEAGELPVLAWRTNLVHVESVGVRNDSARAWHDLDLVIFQGGRDYRYRVELVEPGGRAVVKFADFRASDGQRLFGAWAVMVLGAYLADGRQLTATRTWSRW